jgi:hypothetical protein
MGMVVRAVARVPAVPSSSGELIRARSSAISALVTATFLGVKRQLWQQGRADAPDNSCRSKPSTHQSRFRAEHLVGWHPCWHLTKNPQPTAATVPAASRTAFGVLVSTIRRMCFLAQLSNELQVEGWVGAGPSRRYSRRPSRLPLCISQCEFAFSLPAGCPISPAKSL